MTEFDLESEALIRRGLQRHFPGEPVVGEESGLEGSDVDIASVARASGPVWYVDPIDGTNNFAHGHPFFCISVGLWWDGQPALGCVSAPAMGLVFSGAIGVGVFRSGAPVGVSSTADLASALLCTGFSPGGAQAEANYAKFEALDAATHGVRRCAAAALEIALVASGGYDGFWDFGLKPWDSAAAAALVVEAGGRVTDMNGRPYSLESPTLVASNGRLHADLLRALEGVG